MNVRQFIRNFDEGILKPIDRHIENPVFRTIIKIFIVYLIFSLALPIAITLLLVLRSLF